MTTSHKTGLVVSALLLALVAPGCAVDSHTRDPAFDGERSDASRTWPLVRWGDLDRNVVTVQYLLRHHGYEVSLTGLFDDVTYGAVRSFQSDNGLSVDGIVGTNTWGALIVMVRPGDANNAVRAVQDRLLETYGYSLSVTGEFGPTTEERVLAFQDDHCLTYVDAIVGPETWHALVADVSYCDGGGTCSGASDGLPVSFDRNRIMSDGFFRGGQSMTGDDVQAFLEQTPYGTRSWLADYRVGGRRAADAILDASRQEGINPVVMLARMQVEQSLVSKTVAPSQFSIDYAFGCGCPDGQACNPAYRGLDRQIACAADTLRRHYDGSADGTGAWRAGVSRQTLDPLTVTPANHATASLYAYTPWVLEGQGGNWLVWTITRSYAEHFESLGSPSC